MKLEDLGNVVELARRRCEIKTHLTYAMTRPDSLNVVITGTYMDDAMVALVKPVVVGELSARIAVIDRQLEQLGVDTQ